MDQFGTTLAPSLLWGSAVRTKHAEPRLNRVAACVIGAPLNTALTEHFSLRYVKIRVRKKPRRHREHAGTHLNFLKHDSAATGAEEVAVRAPGVG